MMKKQECELRQQLACAFRWSARLGLHEGVANHYSVAVDEAGHQFLINPAGKHFSKIKAQDLLLLDVANDKPTGVDETAWCLHSYFHRHLSHGRCLLHTHAPYTTALASLANWHLQPIDQNACRFYNRIAYDENFGGMLLAEEEAARQCQVIGDKPILLMRGHGVLVVASNIALAFDLLYYFERTCYNQWLALSSGEPLFQIAPDIAEKTAQQWECFPYHHHFDELQAILTAEEPEYKN